jgi:hypothetical protein
MHEKIKNLNQLCGAENFKASLATAENSESGLTLHFLWLVRRGGGVTTMLDILARTLEESRRLEFCGDVRFIEFSAEYISPENFFSELKRLNDALLRGVGRRHEFKGILCVNLDNWGGHESEAHFETLLEFLAYKQDKLMLVFTLHSTDKITAKKLEAAVGMKMCLEVVEIDFPKPEKLAAHIEEHYIKSQGLALSDGARELMTKYISRISTSERFAGFKTTERLAENILRSFRKSDVFSEIITEEVVERCCKDYMERLSFLESPLPIKRRIGFATEEVVK